MYFFQFENSQQNLKVNLHLRLKSMCPFRNRGRRKKRAMFSSCAGDRHERHTRCWQVPGVL